MAAKTLTVFFNAVKTAFLSLAFVLFMCKVVSSQALSYYVDSLDETRKAMLSYSSVPSGGKWLAFLRGSIAFSVFPLTHSHGAI